MSARNIHLMDARHYARLAPELGINETARTLISTGRLVPVNIGPRTYYRWSELIPLLPADKRPSFLTEFTAPVVTSPTRLGLTGHTVTVECATRLTAIRLGVRPGTRVVVERRDGDLTNTVRLTGKATINQFARVHADRVGARYVAEGTSL
ncbi:hypothetical protein [Spirillospora sp. CA-294931]|uniref:hypothetical protein n=1 Tax=Spirillospora sp. CA-294931 TaxID=3240042 RepID=UPI003D89DC6A